MIIEVIDYGYENTYRAHVNDAGADVKSLDNYFIKPGETVKIPLGFGVRLPDGFVGYINPRSSTAAKGYLLQNIPIDSGYRGQLHAVLTNVSEATIMIEKGDRIGQLVVLPVILPKLVDEKVMRDYEKRGEAAFGSTGK